MYFFITYLCAIWNMQCRSNKVINSQFVYKASLLLWGKTMGNNHNPALFLMALLRHVHLSCVIFWPHYAEPWELLFRWHKYIVRSAVGAFTIIWPHVCTGMTCWHMNGWCWHVRIVYVYSYDRISWELRGRRKIMWSQSRRKKYIPI